MVYNNINKLSIILACYGDMHKVKKGLEVTLKSIMLAKQNIDLIVVSSYDFELDYSMIKNEFPSVKIIKVVNEITSLATLINIGIKHVVTDYIAFAWPGSHFDKLIISFAKNKVNIDDVFVIKSLCTNKVLIDPPQALIYGWLMCCKLYEINNIIVSKKALNKVGELDESILLQKSFDWEWLFRLSRSYIFKSLGSATNENNISIENYPYSKNYKFDDDIVHRYIVRSRPLAYNINDMYKKEVEFINDLPAEQINNININSNGHIIHKVPSTQRKCYKITIIGGYWEYHHNQLVFFNYLDNLIGKGFATYKVLLDFLVEPKDIEGSDLVIITRSRNNNILRIIEKCEKQNISTLYMLDDNWLTIAQDLPEVYGNLFVKGNIQFDTFIEAITRCKAVITYNKILYDDLSSYNNNVILFPLTINLNYYKGKVDTNIHGESQIIIGYAGSIRHDTTAFLALANIAKNNDNIKVLIFGNVEKDENNLFEGVNLIKFDYAPYPLYCKKMIEVSPDILIAPLIDNKTSRCKCPNKYFESGAVKAAGVYSNIPPYKDIIVHGKNGILINENTQSAWEEGISTLVNDKELLNNIKKNSHKDIQENYSTLSKLKEFCNMIEEVIF